MNKKIALIVLLPVILLFSVVSYAETIKLKSGSSVEGKIIEKSDKYIKIDFQGVQLTYYFDEIESIDGNKISSNPEEAQSEQQSSNGLLEYDSQDSLFKIKYPRGWFVHKDEVAANGITLWYFTREEIKKPEDFIKAGVTVGYSKNYPNLTELPWQQFIITTVESVQNKGWKVSNLAVDIRQYGWPAFMFVEENENVRMLVLRIKINSDLLQVTCEAPKSEAAQFANIFSDIISSLKVKNSPS